MQVLCLVLTPSTKQTISPRAIAQRLMSWLSPKRQPIIAAALTLTLGSHSPNTNEGLISYRSRHAIAPQRIDPWDNTGSIDPASPLRLQNCQGSRTWLVYPGGVWTIEPACVTLLVLTDTARPQPMCPAFQGSTEPSRVAPSPTTPFPMCRTLGGRPTRDPPTLSLSRQVGAAIGLPNPGGQTDEEVPGHLRRRLE